jgi:hypothetical protein
VPSLNPQGQQYTFDLQELTGYGTGAGCPMVGSARQLVGYLAKYVAQNDYTVTQTTVVLSGGGSHARNGTTTVLGKHVAQDSELWRRAHSVTCGTGGQAREPQ